MKFNKLLKKLKSYLDADAELIQQEDEGLSKVLKKLKQKENLLKEEIAVETNDEERELMEQELNIVHSQRKKGIELLSNLRKTGSSK
ncbi:MAG: hypothetical protein ABUK11_07335 [Mariprofundaceae bacterium]